MALRPITRLVKGGGASPTLDDELRSTCNDTVVA